MNELIFAQVAVSKQEAFEALIQLIQDGITGMPFAQRLYFLNLLYTLADKFPDDPERLPSQE
jgi:hypothetical protein